MNTDLVLSLLIALLEHANEISSLIKNAKAEGRDITEEELDAIFDKDTAARERLAEAIAKARAAGH